VLAQVDVPFTEPLKVAGPTVEAAAKAAKEAKRLGEPEPVVVEESAAEGRRVRGGVELTDHAA
jgi:hypothetical protein